MHETIPCPECHAELALPSLPIKQAVKCRCCKRVFMWVSVAVTADAPQAGPRNTNDRGVRDEPIRLLPRRELRGKWCALAARVSLAANAAALLMPAAYFLYDRVLYRWLAPGIYFRNELLRPGRELHMLAEHAEFWILATAGPAFVAFFVWLYMAARNAQVLTLRVLSWPTLMLAFLFVPVVNGIMLYLILQEIWRASDPAALDTAESGRKGAPSWLVHAWGISLLSAVGLVLLFIKVDNLSDTWIACSATVNVAVTGILLAGIVRAIMKRQQERYRRLFKE